jgi:superfamily II DNA or RNA helicase
VTGVQLMLDEARVVELNVAPGSVVIVRDEEWLVTAAECGADGWLLRVQGLSELVRDSTASFYSSLDDIEVLDPAKAKVVADDSSGYRRSRLWLEATLRKTPVPQSDSSLTVSSSMLADKLGYQRVAVAKALDPLNIRPRILIADAVGLGKTLEIGMILSELIRRGRGERILIVTPRHVLEQMQHELWCRFALPFVRLDSVGIQRVRQQLPATRNPFTYFKRAIISIDTLKSPRYKAHLARQHWDAVVIDESHNLTNTGTLNNELARILAPNTEALILASATPHNGKQESFAELLRLLDPTAVSADGSFRDEDVKRLLIRRHRHSDEVASEVGADWAERAEPVHTLVKPSAAEDAIATELSEAWLHPGPKGSPYSGQTAGLFPWTLAKAFLSSPAALGQSIKERLKKLDGTLDSEAREVEALQRLQGLVHEAFNEEAGKFAALVAYLKKTGLGPKSTMRAVVFAERVATLKWLEEKLPKALGLKDENVAMLHGGLSDVDQQQIVESFKQESSTIRVLVTGDVASEGVNLHAQCHHLIHYDIPWSLIRIEQRNGRIDRYGQKYPPVIASLILQPSDDKFTGDLRVLSRLLERENEAHTTLGDVASLMGKHSVKAEEDAILGALQGKQKLEDIVRSPEEVAECEDLDGLFASLFATGGSIVPPEGSTMSLYANSLKFLDEALTEAYITPGNSPSSGGVGWRIHAQQSIAELTPPKDLQDRLRFLPQTYLADRRVTTSLKLATSIDKGKEELARALKGLDGTTWPEAHYLGPLHPVLDWASDRALGALARNQVFAIRGLVEEPTVLLMGTLMNRRGQLVSRVYIQATFPNPGNDKFCLTESIPDLSFLMESTGLRVGSTNPGPVANIESLQGLVGVAVAKAEANLGMLLHAEEESSKDRLEVWRKRSRVWQEGAEQLELFGSAKGKVTKLSARIREEEKLAALMAPSTRLIRPLLVVVPEDVAAVLTDNTEPGGA